MRAAVSGWATLDYVVAADRLPACGGTVTAQLLMRGGWPRAGGAPYLTAAALAAGGIAAAPLVEVGDDPHGLLYRTTCTAAGLDPAGIAIGGTSTRCILAHGPDGRYLCLLEPGRPVTAAPTEDQTRLAAAADLVCVAAADPAVTGRLLDVLRPDQRLAWLVKADPASFPPDLARRLRRRADIVFRNGHERAFCEAAGPGRPDAVEIETDGGGPVRVTSRGADCTVTVEPIVCRDATGAGDTLAGAALARLLTDPGDIAGAVHAGIRAAGKLLQGRARLV